MSYRRFHGANARITTPKRRIGEELLDLFVWYLEVATTRGRSLTWNHSFPNRHAYHNAVYRLREHGLIAGKRSGDKEGYLELADDVDAHPAQLFLSRDFPVDIRLGEATRWRTSPPLIFYVDTQTVGVNAEQYMHSCVSTHLVAVFNSI